MQLLKIGCLYLLGFCRAGQVSPEGWMITNSCVGRLVASLCVLWFTPARCTAAGLDCFHHPAGSRTHAAVLILYEEAQTEQTDPSGRS